MDMPGEASRPRARSSGPVKAGAEIRGEVLLTLAQLCLATPHQLKALLLPHHQEADYIRRALRNLRADALVGPESPRPAELLVLHPGGTGRSRRLR
ncbi:hypothetical protein [Streptomyces sp. NPDC046727]|uniref:hypothetical protein n=1 Tax=Streptomyces sp. NPDC046727 TaxID=3155373 RepID=UPI0033D3C928